MVFARLMGLKTISADGLHERLQEGRAPSARSRGQAPMSSPPQAETVEMTVEDAELVRRAKENVSPRELLPHAWVDE